MIVHGDASRSDGESLIPGWRVAALSGVVLGAISAYAARGLRPSLARLAILVVLISTFVAGRVARLGPALAHGACAWVAIVATATLTHMPVEPWHGIPAVWILFVLIEDMVLLGRAGRRRRPDQ